MQPKEINKIVATFVHFITNVQTFIYILTLTQIPPYSFGTEKHSRKKKFTSTSDRQSVSGI